MVAQWQQIFLIVLVLLVFASFVREWLAPELTALVALFACICAGLLPVADGSRFDALRVFGHPAPITVACMFILSAALERTGVIDTLADWFESYAGRGPLTMLVVLMAVAAFLSGFVNNTPVVVVFMPLVIGLCRKKDWAASKYLIPLSYAAIAGGTMTIIGTSTNLIASEIAREKGLAPMTMFEVTPLGLVFVAATIIYLLTLGRKLLPDRVTLAALLDSETAKDYITHGSVAPESSLIGKPVTETLLKGGRSLKVLDVLRRGERLDVSLDQLILEEGDEVFFKGKSSDLAEVLESGELGTKSDDLEQMRTESAVIMEGIVGPQSALVGKSLKELNFRRTYGVIVLAVHRQGKNLRERFEDVRLAFGDTLLAQGPASRMQSLFAQRDFINLSAPTAQAKKREKAWIALGAIIAFAGLGVLGETGVVPKIPVAVIALGAALLVMVTRCIQPEEAYESIEWKVLFLIFGMLGLGLALERSGLAGRMAEQVVNFLGKENPGLVLAGVYLLAAVMTEVISNNAVAALLTPLAIVLGTQMDVDPRPLVIAVMFGSSASFSTPIGYQTNTFVYGAGGYKFVDFFKVGAPLAVALWLLASFLIPVIWPFHPA